MEAGGIHLHRRSRTARLIARPFHRLLDRIDRGLECGAIEAQLPDGTARLIGGRADGPVAIRDLQVGELVDPLVPARA